MNPSDRAAEQTALEIIGFFYPEDTPFRQMLLKHSYQVCGKALELLDNPCVRKLNADRETVVTGALLHDVGIDGSPPGSPVPGILQARTLEWVAISFSNA